MELQIKKEAPLLLLKMPSYKFEIYCPENYLKIEYSNTGSIVPS